MAAGDPPRVSAFWDGTILIKITQKLHKILSSLQRIKASYFFPTYKRLTGRNLELCILDLGTKPLLKRNFTIITIPDFSLIGNEVNKSNIFFCNSMRKKFIVKQQTYSFTLLICYMSRIIVNVNYL